jgi:hypothetical protein
MAVQLGSTTPCSENPPFLENVRMPMGYTPLKGMMYVPLGMLDVFTLATLTASTVKTGPASVRMFCNSRCRQRAQELHW